MRKYNKKTKADKYQLVADKLLALMTEGTLPWRRLWRTTLCGNALSGNAYIGINPLLAQADVMACNYSTTLFVGYEQAAAIGWSLKGSKATWLKVGGKRRKKKVDAETGEESEYFYWANDWQKTFNLDWVDDSEADLKVADVIARFKGKPNLSARIDDAEKLIAAQNAEIVFGGNRACYIPSLDKVHLPDYESFSSPEAYYATLIHELIHRTGHFSRLDRNLKGEKGGSAYAFEELVADMGSAFLCETLGIRSDLENHASYLAYWMDIIRNDNKAFFKAFSLAQSAADLLLDNAGMLTATESDVEAA